MEDLDEVFALMVLCNTPNIGGRIARLLISHFGSANATLNASKGVLRKLAGIGDVLASNIKRKEGLIKAEKSLNYCQKHNIKIVQYKSKSYPQKLLQISDSPLILYVKGNVDLNFHHFIGIVGTRKPTAYGKINCEKLVSNLSKCNIVTVSGLAFGIDVCVHKASLKHNIPTIAILGHGHEYLYPASHRIIAEKMLDNGALISEFPPDQEPERNNFPARNRIIAGLSDATVIVESAAKGGSMITAEFANQYNREVFAFPGRANDPLSKGCNHLIKTHKAHLLESADDLQFLMEINSKSNDEKQLQLFESLNRPEKRIVETIQQYGICLLDRLILSTNLNLGELSGYLINLECKGILACLPGKRYIIV